MMNNEAYAVDVSFSIRTYCQEKFVEECLESILSQETTYSYELVVYDDGSTDYTYDIIKKFEEKYPDMIRAFRNEKNCGIPLNRYRCNCACRGKYIIEVAGDDYFIDKAVVQNCVSYMETHPEYTAVYNCAEVRMDNETTAVKIIPDKSLYNKEYTLKDYETGVFPGEFGIIRNVYLDEPKRAVFERALTISEKVDDAVFFVLLLRMGKMYIRDYTPYVHRVFSKPEKNYNSLYSSFERFEQHLELYNRFYEWLGKEVSFKNAYIDIFNSHLGAVIKEKGLKYYIKCYKSIPLEYRKPFKTGVFAGVIKKRI